MSTMARDARVAVFERVNSDEPQMRDAGLEHGIDVLLRIEPRNKCFHVLRYATQFRRFAMHALAHDRP
jgi:hypothetical protein